MAWKGRVAAKRSDQAGGSFTLEIDFYDDVDPAVMIVRRTVIAPISATLVELVALVRDAGAQERAKFVALKAVVARVPDGYEVTV